MNTHALHKEAEAARAMLASVRDQLGDDDDAIADAVEGETDLMEAIDTALRRLARIDSHVAALAAQREELARREARLGTQSERIRAAIVAAMQVADLRKIERPAATLSLSVGKPKVAITDEALLPSDYIREKVTLSPDKGAILAALTATQGGTVPGAKLVAGDVGVRIRRV